MSSTVEKERPAAETAGAKVTEVTTSTSISNPGECQPTSRDSGEGRTIQADLLKQPELDVLRNSQNSRNSPPSIRLDEWAYQGLAGDIVKTIEPHTEADPAAILVQLLVAFGNAVGRSPHFMVEADAHHVNEYVVIVGRSAKSRKGTSMGHVKRLLGAADPVWARDCISDGLSSGEGLICSVRDADSFTPAIEEMDSGITDKRLLAMAPEFASVLRTMERNGNTLSSTARNLWDSGDAKIMTKNNPVKATNAHVSCIGHITTDELKRYLTQTELANGFGNRFIFVAAERSKILPEGGSISPEALAPLQERLREAVNFARTVGVMVRDADARILWRDVYPRLSADRYGLAGSLTSRAEAHVTRLSCIYALLDKSATIRPCHLNAALAVWSYAEKSIESIFGDSRGKTEETILLALEGTPDGLSRTEISALLGHHKTSAEISRCLANLKEQGLASPRTDQKPGSIRPVEVWTHANYANYAKPVQQ